MRTATSLFLLPLVLLAPFQTFAAEERPGYGVVQSITVLPAPSTKGEESASAGASAPRKKPRPSYLVKVRMDDGTIQVRNQKTRDFKVGDRVLITNAGTAVPE